VAEPGGHNLDQHFALTWPRKFDLSDPHGFGLGIGCRQARLFENGSADLHDFSYSVVLPTSTLMAVPVIRAEDQWR
jgi:hypothetical protein